MKVNFRGRARARLAQAKIELAAGDDERVKYAALELRMAIEAVTYDRAQAFKAEIPPTDYAVWQPKRLMQLLLEIDPTADQAATISLGLEPSPGVAPAQMHTLGTDRPFSLKSIKAHYDALGSYLHLPTLRQFETGTTPDVQKLRVRCDDIVKELEAVLSSSVFNTTLGKFATLDCVRCSKPIRKRVPDDARQIDTRCFECGAPYLVSALPDGKAEWIKQAESLCCLKCEAAITVWKDKIQEGEQFKCEGCGAHYVLVLRASLLSDSAVSSA